MAKLLIFLAAALISSGCQDGLRLSYSWEVDLSGSGPVMPRSHIGPP